jgi:CRISPR-associated protein Csb1
LFKDAVAAAKKVGLPWREEPLVLTPSEQLVKLVVKSQNLAANQGGDSGEGGE